MSNQNAVCDCQDRSEKDLVLAVKQGRFGWTEQWGFFTWLIVLILTLTTGGFWIAVVLGYHLFDILNPKNVCQFCGAKIKDEQLRGFTNTSTTADTTDNSV